MGIPMQFNRERIIFSVSDAWEKKKRKKRKEEEKKEKKEERKRF